MKKPRVNKPPVRKARANKTPEKKTSEKRTPARQTVSYRTFITGTLPARIFRWTPAKAVVTFPYRAYCWASDVAEEYRSFAVSRDQ